MPLANAFLKGALMVDVPCSDAHLYGIMLSNRRRKV